ncbi:MAG: hypothetical protein ACLS29_08225 [Prevotellamassilia sp.]
MSKSPVDRRVARRQVSNRRSLLTTNRRCRCINRLDGSGTGRQIKPLLTAQIQTLPNRVILVRDRFIRLYRLRMKCRQTVRKKPLIKLAFLT